MINLSNYTYPLHNRIYKSRTSSSISFGIRLESDAYANEYKKKKNPNGKNPDIYIQDQLKKYFPDPTQARVLELGTGDGRNAIPVAKIGYNVTALEVCKKAKKPFAKFAKKENVTNKVEFVIQNFLDEWTKFEKETKFDFAYMVHTAQHFTVDQISVVLSNLNKTMKKNGIFVFDALIRNPDHEDIMLFTEDEKIGCAHFSKKKLLKVIDDNGFNLIDETIFNEQGTKRAEYESQLNWGTNKGGLNKSVKLKWLILKKIKNV